MIPALKNANFPLTKMNLNKLDGIQKGIPLFEGVKIEDIAFAANRFETLNLFRGCSVGCSHCLKNAKPIENGTILFEDLMRFLDGFKTLNERLGFNVFQKSKYVSIADDANPSDFPIKGKERVHTLGEAVKAIYEKISLPPLIVTSGWNRGSKYAQSSSEELARIIEQKPETAAAVEISINPFSGIMEKSRNALKNSNQNTADFLRNVYTDRMANVLKVFLNLFGIGKAKIIYRHAPDYKGNELVGERETRKLYEEIYAKLKNAAGSRLEHIPELKPENITHFNKSHLIESSGRGRCFFPTEYNLREQGQLIDEVLERESLTRDEKQQELFETALKCVDINGRIYATMPADKVECISSPIEITVPTKIKLNYENNKNIPPVFSDIDL